MVSISVRHTRMPLFLSTRFPAQHAQRSTAIIGLAGFLLFASIIGGIYHRSGFSSFHQEEYFIALQQHSLGRKRPTSVTQSAPSVIGPCAINLYGLPRKFKALVLPSFVKHVIEVNAKYQCDYFVHYYDRREESDYRGADRGRGGSIDPEEIKLLTEQVMKAQNRRVTDAVRNPVVVDYIKDTEESFFERYESLLARIHTERTGANGKPLYIPTSEKESFPNATLVNIVKMWHSQQAVWNLMEPVLTGNTRHYSRVAMFRSDVLYVTPIDIYQLPDGSADYDNQFAVIPNFGNFPVNDRMIYGPADAVQIWAAGRFQRLAEHVQRVANTGDGIHPEKFLYHTIFPAIRDAGVPVLAATERLCFLRVRSDASVRIGDCGLGCVTDQNHKLVEHIVQRPCLLNRTNPNVAFLECNDEVQERSPKRSHYHSETASWETCSNR
jgi:hypothetical protein